MHINHSKIVGNKRKYVFNLKMTNNILCLKGIVRCGDIYFGYEIVEMLNFLGILRFEIDLDEDFKREIK